MRSTHFFSCVALAAAVGGVACSSNSSTPTSNDYDDVAQSTAALVAPSGGGGEMGSMAEASSIAIGVTPVGVTANASGSFNGVNAGVTYDFTLSCTSASGAALPACGPTTNDAQASVTWSGNLTLPDYTASVSRNGSWTLSGLQSGTATFNGTGSLTFAATFESSFRNEQANANLSYAASYNAVTYDETAHFATGGSIQYTVNGSESASNTGGSSSGSFTMNAMLTFAASGTATLTLDGSHTYTITSAGTVTKI